jgi:hypothetical protein
MLLILNAHLCTCDVPFVKICPIDIHCPLIIGTSEPVRSENPTSPFSSTADTTLLSFGEYLPTQIIDSQRYAGCGNVGQHRATEEVVLSVLPIHPLSFFERIIEQLTTGLEGAGFLEESFLERYLIAVVESRRCASFSQDESYC